MGLMRGTLELSGLMRGALEVDSVFGGTQEVWSNGIGRLFHSSIAGIGELDPATYAVIQPLSNTPSNASRWSLGGMGKHLFQHSWNAANSFSREVNPDTRLEIRRVAINMYEHIGGTDNKLFGFAINAAYPTYSPDAIVEIDPTTFGILRAGSPYDNNRPWSMDGVGGKLYYGTLDSENTDGGYLREINPDTLLIVRYGPMIYRRAQSMAGLKDQLFIQSSAYSGTGYLRRINTDTFAIINEVRIGFYDIGGTK